MIFGLKGRIIAAKEEAKGEFIYTVEVGTFEPAIFTFSEHEIVRMK